MTHANNPAPHQSSPPTAAAPGHHMDIAILAAGAGGMYCGSCLRDSALATALLSAGHRVTLVPMYTPLKTEGQNLAISDVFYGGVNVYLQHLWKLFRHTPRIFDWLLDRPGLLQLAGRFGAQTSPARLGPLTVDILKGETGPAIKELRRLVGFLKTDVRPQVISLPNLMFIGLARLLQQEIGVPVVCELTGEDLFLSQLVEPYRSRARTVIRERARDGTRFIATSSYYADEMARYLDVDRHHLEVVPVTVPADYVLTESSPAPRPQDRPPTVGYFARICPEKGFGHLLDAMQLLRRMPGMAGAKLIAGGFLGSADRAWFDHVMRRAQATAPPGAIHYAGELDRRRKLELLDSIDVLSVPTLYAEAKGIYVIEALARGVPVVQPAHGSFPELLDITAGGVLVPPGDLPALATALSHLLRDDIRRAALGRAGQQAVRRGLTHAHMADRMLDIYRRLLTAPAPAPHEQPTAPAVESGND